MCIIDYDCVLVIERGKNNGICTTNKRCETDRNN